MNNILMKKPNNIEKETKLMKHEPSIRIYENEYGKVRIEIGRFMNIQKNIMEKYLDKLENESDFEKLDKYFMQILEEIYEVKVADGKIEVYKEAIDVLMYLGSTIALLKINCKTHFNYETDPLIEYNYYKETIKNITLEKFLDNTFKAIFRCRRLFSERKWHKPHIKLNETEKQNDLLFCIEELREVLIQGIIYLNKEDKKTGIDLFNLVDSKQGFIKNL